LHDVFAHRAAADDPSNERVQRSRIPPIEKVERFMIAIYGDAFDQLLIRPAPPSWIRRSGSTGLPDIPNGHVTSSMQKPRRPMRGSRS
jgi:hypothetical protein